MRDLKRFGTTAALCLAFVNLAAAQRTETEPLGSTLCRVGGLEGATVESPQGQILGRAADLILDAETGRIRFLALQAGGILGSGGKLFAVPWRAVRVVTQDDRTVLELNVSYQALRNAASFDPQHWPDVADPHWADSIEQYFGRPERHAEVVALNGRELTVLRPGGERIAYMLTEGVFVHQARRTADLDALRPGTLVVLTIEKRNEGVVVSEIAIVEGSLQVDTPQSP